VGNEGGGRGLWELMSSFVRVVVELVARREGRGGSATSAQDKTVDAASAKNRSAQKANDTMIATHTRDNYNLATFSSE